MEYLQLYNCKECTIIHAQGKSFPVLASTNRYAKRYQIMLQQMVQIMITAQYGYKNMATPVILHQFLEKVIYLQLRLDQKQINHSSVLSLIIYKNSLKREILEQQNFVFHTWTTGYFTHFAPRRGVLIFFKLAMIFAYF